MNERAVALASLVPTTLLPRLRGRGAAPTPWEERFPAAVLFADVSGFTALAERLAERGPAGAELLTDALNSAFGTLLKPVDARGGEVVRFAGDAAIALFPAHSRPLANVVAAAVACGLEIQQAMAARPSVAGETLSVRVGVSCGDVWTGRVGGIEGRWEYLAAGDPVEEMGTAAAAAKPGQVALAPSAAALVSDRVHGALGQDGILVATSVDAPSRMYPTLFEPPAEAAMRPFIPRTALSRLDAGQTDWLAEFRRVSIVFAGFSGVDYAAKDALTNADAMTRAAQEAVYRFDGSVNQLVVDDKGTTLVAAWGLPSRTHEDDAERAVRAALALRDAAAALGLGCSVGVTAGRAFTGMRGSKNRREYAMLGEIVNLSARLMQAAGGGIYVEKTAALAASRVTFDEAAALKVKGRATPVEVVRPAATTGVRRMGSTRLVGRAEEIAKIAARLDAVGGGSGPPVVVLEGEPGIGKSRLIEQATLEAGRRGLRVLAGAADAVESATAYFVWRAPLRAVFADVEDGAPLAAAVLARLAGDERLTSWAPLLSKVLPLSLPDNSVTSQMSGESRGEGVRELVVRLLSTEAERAPLLVVLDDAHWFDSAAWSGAAEVARRVRPAIVLLGTRPPPEPPPTDYARLVREGAVLRIEVRALGREDAVELVKRRLGVESIPEAAAAFIRERAGGNPFFGEQLALALRDAGHLVVDGASCRLAKEGAPLAALDVPQTVQGVIAGRLDRLTAQQQLTLKVASVIGRAFAFAALTAVHPVDEDHPALPGQLDDMARADLVVADAPAPDLSYLFRHVVLQEVAYDLLAFAQRRKLHRALAEWTEQRYAADLGPFLPLLAHHWKRAEDRTKALDYLERAGLSALDNNANAEAARFLSEAMELDAGKSLGVDDAHRSRWHWKSSIALLKLQLWDDCARRLDDAFRLLGRRLPRTKAGLALSLVSQIGVQCAHRAAPRRFIGRAGARRAEVLQAADLHQRRAELGFFLNDVLAMLHAAVAGLNLAEHGGEPVYMAPAYGSLGTCSAVAGMHDLARYYDRLALATLGRVTHMPTDAYTRLIVGVAMNCVGDFDVVERETARAADLFERLGDRMRWETALVIQGVTSLARGRFAKGRELSERVFASANPNGSPANIAWAAAMRVQAETALGVVEQSHVEALEEALRREVDHPTRVQGQGVLAAALARRGDRDAGVSAALQCVALVRRERPVLNYALAGLDGTTRALLDAYQPSLDADAEFAVRALARLARTYPPGRAQAAYAQGRLAQARGRASAARRSFLRAAQEGERLGTLYDAARARAALGDAAKARELFAACGLEGS